MGRCPKPSQRAFKQPTFGPAGLVGTHFINMNLDFFIFYLLICCQKLTNFFQGVRFSHLILPLPEDLTTADGKSRSSAINNQNNSFADSVLNVVGRLLHLPEEAALVLRSHELSLVPDFSSLLNDITLDVSAPDMPRPSLAISRRLRSYAEKVVACVSADYNC